MEKIRVVLVEDDPMVLEVNKSFIAKVSGFTVVGIARTGEQALRVIKETTPDLIILDIYLPDCDGLNILKAVRNQGLPVDFITVTAAQDGETIKHMLRYGVVDYIIKPFKFHRFQAALENYKKRSWLQGMDAVDQADIDRINAPSWYIKAAAELPKNLNQTTMEQVKSILRQQVKGLTAEEVADVAGMARVTARRYLEYLTDSGMVMKELQYGSIGRPINKFRLISTEQNEQ